MVFDDDSTGCKHEPETGPSDTRMKSHAEILSPAEREAFSRSVENVKQAAVAHLKAHAESVYPVVFFGNLHRGVDRVMQEAARCGAGIACKSGCSYCCNARVEASAPEVFRVVDEILSRPQAEIETVVDRLREHVAANVGKSVWKQRTPCPFLEDDRCSIYDIRPVGCRTAHSLDLSACQTGSATLPMSLDCVLAAEALIQGTVEAYRQVGLDATRYEFVSALLHALTDREAKVQWQKGQAVFSDSAG